MRTTKDQFKILNMVSNGTSGQVFKVIHKSTNKMFAMKIIQNVNSQLIEKIERQVKIMKILQSPYALKIFDSYFDQYQNNYCIISEFMQRGDLKGYIEKGLFNFTNKDILGFIMQISLAFIQLNTKNIIHRDLKPANILIANEGQYKLCDFGCSKFIEGEGFKLLKISAPFGTQLYNSPEVYFGQKGANYNKNVDVWPLGIILYQIIYKKHPIKTVNNVFIEEDAQNIFEGRKLISFDNVNNIDGKIVELVKKMLAIKFEVRINWVGIIEYITKNFDYIIYKVEHILDHQISLTKLLCLFVYNLNSSKNNKIFSQSDINNKFTILTNCLIMYQYDKLQLTQQILKKQKPVKQDICILPHVYNQFQDKTKIEDFYKMKQKSKKFREQIKQVYPLEKLQIQIQKSCQDLLKVNNVKDALQKKQLDLLNLLATLRKSFVVRNTNYMQTLFNNFM